MLSHERLDVYQRSIEFVAASLRIVERLPRGQAPLAEQFRRAAMSIPLNIAEGSGRSAESADRAKFRGIARGSAMECGAILDVVRLFEIVPESEWSQAKALLVRIVESSARCVEPPATGTGTRTRTRTRTGKAPAIRDTP